MLYYRTYITSISTNSGVKYYAGKHCSKFEDAAMDPYYGSGIILSSYIRKYGKGCIIGTQWFDHTESTVDTAEIKLISELKDKHKENCVNIAGGGEGGNVFQYMDQPRLDEIRDTRSTKSKNSWQDPMVKALRSESIKNAWKDANVKERASCSHKEVWQRPGFKEKQTETTKLVQRKGLVWELYYSGELVKLWNNANTPSHRTFRKWIAENTNHEIGDLNLTAAIKQMKKDSSCEN